MLRITFAKQPGETNAPLCLLVEGRLDGPSVGELSDAWHSVSLQTREPVEVRLDGVTYASEAGAELLRSMRMQGAMFTANSPLTESCIEDLMAELTRRIAR